MAVSNSTKLLIVLSAAVLIALLFMAPRKSAKTADSSKKQNSPSTSFNFDAFVNESKKQLQPGDIAKLAIFSTEQNQEMFDSCAAIWDKAKQPGIAAFYFEKKAKADNAEKSFINAAYRNFDAFKMAPDSLQRSYFVNKAIENYSKVLEINPNNLDAKTDLGICYAEGTASPMQGIMMLRDVVKQNPNHENAQLNLGFLSIKSGQYDKAIERFNTVLKINPSRIDTYIFIGQTFVQMGNKEKAIENLEKFKLLSNDNNAIAEVNAYIAELKGK